MRDRFLVNTPDWVMYRCPTYVHDIYVCIDCLHMNRRCSNLSR
ncbi:hypothetical protein CSUI_010947 [Cystoisospora suis]|uniref:Uncharacterized protein n=1 Tax=Cystoisospora suis TaxID=483139 RepID=A0A2C6J885_9APIC|nr:hypothetical protein CSUI_010947 [Cystoisospora suis]